MRCWTVGVSGVVAASGGVGVDTGLGDEEFADGVEAEQCCGERTRLIRRVERAAERVNVDCVGDRVLDRRVAEMRGRVEEGELGVFEDMEDRAPGPSLLGAVITIDSAMVA